MTPSARLRASHIVLAGNIHLGAPLRRLSETLLPVWRYAAVTAPLGERLAEAITFQGSVTDSDGIDHFRIVDGDRLMWASPETTWDGAAAAFCRAPLRAGSARSFPQLGKVEIAEVWGGAVGQTVHGMPQIGQLRKGLWVASGFGRQGLNTSAMAGQLIARSILWGDERWRLFSPFELVWAGGADRPGRRPCRSACGGGEAPPPPARWPATGKGRGPRSASARRGWPRPIARPEPGRRARRPPPGRPRPERPDRRAAGEPGEGEAGS